MQIKLYVITDRNLIELFEDNDIDGLKQYLEEDDTLYFEDPVLFNTESETLAFCAGLGYGIDDHNPVDRLPLRSFEECDKPFIELIEQY